MRRGPCGANPAVPTAWQFYAESPNDVGTAARPSKHPDFDDREMVRCQETTKSAKLITGEFLNDVLCQSPRSLKPRQFYT